MVPYCNSYASVVAATVHLGWISSVNINNIALKSKKIKHSLNSATQQFQRAVLDRVLAIKLPLVHQALPSSEVIRLLRDSTRATELGHPDNIKMLIKWRDVEYQHSTWEDEYIVRQSPCNTLERFIRMKEFELHYLQEHVVPLKDFRIPPTPSLPLEPRE